MCVPMAFGMARGWLRRRAPATSAAQQQMPVVKTLVGAWRR